MRLCQQHRSHLLQRNVSLSYLPHFWSETFLYMHTHAMQCAKRIKASVIKKISVRMAWPHLRLTCTWILGVVHHIFHIMKSCLFIEYRDIIGIRCDWWNSRLIFDFPPHAFPSHTHRTQPYGLSIQVDRVSNHFNSVLLPFNYPRRAVSQLERERHCTMNQFILSEVSFGWKVAEVLSRIDRQPDRAEQCTALTNWWAYSVSVLLLNC